MELLKIQKRYQIITILLQKTGMTLLVLHPLRYSSSFIFMNL